MPKRMIDSEIWSHPDFQPMSQDGRILFVWTWSNPHCNAAGLYVVSKTTISNETQLDDGLLPQLFEELKAINVEWYPDKHMIWVKNFLRRQLRSSTFLIAVAKCLEGMSDTKLVQEYLKYNKDFAIPYTPPGNGKAKKETKTGPCQENFIRFWNEYPRKKSQGQAERAFLKLNPDAQLLTTILDNLKRAKQSPEWLKDGGRFIPYPATWLNAKGWEDEYKTTEDSEWKVR